MTDQSNKPQDEREVPASESSRLADLDELTATIQRRLRRNQLFLERFMDEDFEDNEEETDPEEPEMENAQETG